MTTTDPQCPRCSQCDEPIPSAVGQPEPHVCLVCARLTPTDEALTAAFTRGTEKAIAETRAAGLPVYAWSQGKVVVVPEKDGEEEELDEDGIPILH
jgi:hypothetical protein